MGTEVSPSLLILRNIPPPFALFLWKEQPSYSYEPEDAREHSRPRPWNYLPQPKIWTNPMTFLGSLSDLSERLSNLSLDVSWSLDDEMTAKALSLLAWGLGAAVAVLFPPDSFRTQPPCGAAN